MNTGAEAYTAADFRRRASAVSGNEAAPFDRFGDHRLNPGMVAELQRSRLRDAAVLVPVIDTGAEARVLLTMRNASLRRHSGQVAFPGGAIDPDDASPEAAALREAQEEVGLDPAHVETLGRLPDYLTGSGFRITPVLGVVRPGYDLTINADEVDAAFEVPLSFLMDEANHRRESRMWQGHERHYYTMPYGQWFIWGVTAGILRTLYERLYT